MRLFPVRDCVLGNTAPQFILQHRYSFRLVSRACFVPLVCITPRLQKLFSLSVGASYLLKCSSKSRNTVIQKICFWLRMKKVKMKKNQVENKLLEKLIFSHSVMMAMKLLKSVILCIYITRKASAALFCFFLAPSLFLRESKRV